MKITKIFLIIFIASWWGGFCSFTQAAVLTYYRYHIVQKGDTLYDISKQYSVSIKEIKKKNRLKSDRIYPGQKLIISVKIRGIYHPVKRGEYLWRICKTYGVDMEEVIRLNRISDPDNIKEGQKIFIPGATRVKNIKVPEELILKEDISFQFEHSKGELEKRKQITINMSWPVNKDLARYKYSESGTGIDIFAPEGTAIITPADGKVYFSGWLRGYGKTVIIEHPELKIFTCYMHNSVNLVEVGDVVKKGDVIARIGNTGTDEIKLHFEIRDENGKPVDPLQYLSNN